MFANDFHLLPRVVSRTMEKLSTDIDGVMGLTEGQIYSKEDDIFPNKSSLPDKDAVGPDG